MTVVIRLEKYVELVITHHSAYKDSQLASPAESDATEPDSRVVEFPVWTKSRTYAGSHAREREPPLVAYCTSVEDAENMMNG